MVERQVAIKASIQDLLVGEYIQKEGWTPNFIRTTRGPISRTNIMGVLIQEPEPGVFVLDDGSGQVRIRTFEQNKTAAKVGDAVLVIGRPRKYANQLFINYEILKSVKPTWLAYRKEELKHLGAGETVNVVAPESESEEVVVKKSENIFVTVLEVIRKLDAENKGMGADHDKTLATIDNKEAPRVLTSLLEEGEVFEIKPGLLKVLE